MKKFLLIFALVIFCLSCGFPSEQQVKNDFKSANPTFEPISAIVGEGHGDAGYYHIKYKKPSDNKIYEQIWLYLRQDDGNFKITHKEKETIVEK
jgi:opacity protein-like surface antigen